MILSRHPLRALMLVLLLCSLSTFSSALVASGASSWSDYRGRVVKAREAVRRGSAAATTSKRAATDLVITLNGLLPGTEQVDVDGTVVDVDNSIMRSLLAQLDSARDDSVRKSTLEAIDRHLASMQDAVGTNLVPLGQNPEALKELLSQPQLSSRPSLNDLLARLIERLANWLAERLSTVVQRPGSATVVDIVLIGAVAVLLALLGAILWLVVRGLRRSLTDHDARYLREQDYAPVIPAAEGLPADALTFAEDLARQGRFREALRALFGGAARSLVERGLLRSTRTRTDGELLSDLRESAPGVVSPLRSLAETFESAWYGHFDPGVEGFRAAKDDYRETLSAVERTVSAEEREAS